MQKNAIKILIIIIAFLSGLSTLAQEERRIIREGNKLYKEGDYGTAIEKFMRASELLKETKELQSNLGAANYRKGEFEVAVNNFGNIIESSDNKYQKADAFYNIGNSLLQAGEYEKSMQAYKNALRVNPDHNQSRYNMAVANKILEQEQQQQEDEEQEQDEQDSEKEEQDSEQEEQEEQDEQEQSQENNQREMSQDEIESLLEAIENIDRDLQDQVQKQIHESERREVERNW